ncbi:hypothetical protein QBC35DRAFT_145333 [Podospora australis]|uniref:Uncharacterized protein n=1 Tax=Podospora australis TaxID=1536484 RepID=A0AAN6WWP0_9PEZI|nr:hypothetical protein QBC35DRAFT_145333 [Podospora australis]
MSRVRVAICQLSFWWQVQVSLNLSCSEESEALEAGLGIVARMGKLVVRLVLDKAVVLLISFCNIFFSAVWKFDMTQGFWAAFLDLRGDGMYVPVLGDLDITSRMSISQVSFSGCLQVSSSIPVVLNLPFLYHDLPSAYSQKGQEEQLNIVD